MKLKYIVFIVSFFLVGISSLFAISKHISNPQTMMVGAKTISLGGNSALSGDIAHSIMNPATNSDINQFPFSITSQRLLQQFNYLVVSAGIPAVIKFKQKGESYRKEFGINISYGNLSLNKIPKTVSVDGLAYQIGSFSAGYHLAHIGVGTNFYETFSINKIAVGTALKSLTYYVGSENSSTIGIDFGVIGTQYIDNKIISSIELAAVIHNAISPSIEIEKTNNTILLPFEINVGSKVNILNDRLSLLSSINELGFSIGTDFEIEKGVYVRGSTNFKDLRAGIGIELDNIPTGISTVGFKGRFDFNYTHAAFPMNKDGTYVFSLSSLGRSIPKKPEILIPKKPLNITSEKKQTISGVGPKNTTIRIYNNNQLNKSIVTNKFGNWKIENLLLKEGENQLYIKAYDMSKDLSLKSNQVVVISDTTPPDLDVNIFPENSILIVQIESNEKLANISAEIDGKKIRLKEIKKENKEENKEIYLVPTQYEGRAELPLLLGNKTLDKTKKGYKGKAPPQKMNEIDVFATDESGNSIEVGPIQFFGSVTFPIDKHVHYNDMVLVIGNASDIIEDIYINREKVKRDPENRFSIPIELMPGKNVIESTFQTQKNKSLSYFTRVLRLVSYPDMNSKVKGRREIEFLSTLKVLHGDNDGNFYPKKIVTRQFITKLMVLSVVEEELLEEVTTNLFSDVAFDHPFARYIQVGINEGLIYAFPDGTFKPDQQLTLTEIIYLMSNAGIIDYEEVEDSDKLITRAELAEFLAYTPKYERKVETLIDWEKGYNIEKAFE
ncbi:hypothetical protein CL658_01245 [bacterium]|nr:hypothetical protein [bacterium]